MHRIHVGRFSILGCICMLKSCVIRSVVLFSGFIFFLQPYICNLKLNYLAVSFQLNPSDRRLQASLQMPMKIKSIT